MFENSAEIVSAVDNAAAWLTARRGGIGASDAPVLLGEGYGSRYRLWREKRGEIEPQDLSTVEAVRWGIALEATIAEEWAARTGMEVERCGILYRSKAQPFALATPDYTFKELPVEVKNLNFFTKLPKAETWTGWTEPDEWPARFEAQCQWQMFVTGAPAAYNVALVGGQRLVWTRYEADPLYMKELVALGAELWGQIVTGEPPEMEGGDDELDAIEAFWGPDREEEKRDVLPDLGEEVAHWAHVEAALAKEEKEAKEKRSLYTNAIREAMGEYRSATAGGFTYSFSAAARRVDWKPYRPVDNASVQEGDTMLCVATVSIGKPPLRRSGKGA